MDTKTVLITGASRGIGAQAARVFAQAGANVCLAARSTTEIESLADELGPRAIALACDVSRYADLDRAVPGALAPGGRVVTESAAGVPLELPSLEPIRERRYGRTVVTFHRHRQAGG